MRARDGRELPIDGGEGNAALGLQQMLRKVNTRASLMLIVAHPDDEDGGMLAFCSRGLGARVAMLTLNRGEGGQNAMTGDFGDALGLLRTQELLAADRYTGVDQMFGTEVDFGFSKTKAESLAKWTHDRVLYDAVRAVRLYRPLVIASVFIGGVTDGHGHHQVAGQIAQEVYTAAGDPKVFPELTAEGILPWQAEKVYARVPTQSITPKGMFDYATGQYVPASFKNYVTGLVTKEPPTAEVVVHEGATDPLLTYAAAHAADFPSSYRGSEQLSYVQFARIGLGLQKTQIGGSMRVPPVGTFDVAYHRYAMTFAYAHADTREEDFFEGIDTRFVSIATIAPAAPDWLPKELNSLGDEITDAQTRASDPATSAGVADLLADVLRRVDLLLQRIATADIPADQKADLLHEMRVKRVQLNDALSFALGLTLGRDSSGA